MEPEVRDCLARIHGSPCQLVLVVTGAGSRALEQLLALPGSSRTVLEGLVPYAQPVMADYLGFQPHSYTGVPVARAMAARAYARARRWAATNTPVLGVACAGTLATDRPKRGDHNATVTVWDGQVAVSRTLVLEKGARTREEEEALVSWILLDAVALACGVEGLPEPRWLTGDVLTEQCDDVRDPVASLLEGTCAGVLCYPDGLRLPDPPLGGTLYPGAFNPLHPGHRQLAQAAARRGGSAVVYELSATNVDKPPLTPDEIERRLAQFGEGELALVTAAPTFVQKARLCPGSTFVIGFDTLERLFQARYYGGEAQMVAAFREMRELGCGFIVGGRVQDGEFRTLEDGGVPDEFRSLFQGLSEAQFRLDLSSTSIRSGSG